MTGWPTGSPQNTPVGPRAPATPDTTFQPGSILTRAKSLPMPALARFTVLPMAASVTMGSESVGSTRVATCITTVPEAQWPAVPMYFEAPSVKTKFMLQAAGYTMQPPADTAW